MNANSASLFTVEVTINASPAGYAVRDRLTPLERHALTCGCDIPGYHDPDYMAELDEQARRNGTNTGEQPF